MIADLFGSESYEDCILENMEGVESDLAARAVILACQTKTARKTEAKPNSDNTCYFLYELKTNRFKRINATDYEKFSESNDRSFVTRDGVNVDEHESAAELLIEANKHNSSNLETLKALFLNFQKIILHPQGITQDHIRAQADRVPYCSR